MSSPKPPQANKFDLQAPELEERFEFLQLELNMDIEILSEPFMETLANLNGSFPRELYGDDFEYMITPELVQSFCNHVILWCYAHGVPLLR